MAITILTAREPGHKWAICDFSSYLAKRQASYPWEDKRIWIALYCNTELVINLYLQNNYISLGLRKNNKNFSLIQGIYSRETKAGSFVVGKKPSLLEKYVELLKSHDDEKNSEKI